LSNQSDESDKRDERVLNRYAWDMLHSQVMYHVEHMVQGRRDDADQAEQDRLWSLMKGAYEEFKGTMDVSTVDLYLILGLAEAAARLLITLAAVANKRLAEYDEVRFDVLEMMVDLAPIIDGEEEQ
jgi:hypothetical protein